MQSVDLTHFQLPIVFLIGSQSDGGVERGVTVVVTVGGQVQDAQLRRTLTHHAFCGGLAQQRLNTVEGGDCLGLLLGITQQAQLQLGVGGGVAQDEERSWFATDIILDKRQGAGAREDGQALLVRGDVKVDAHWGELQIVAHQVELETTAIDEDGFESLKSRAKAEGWLESSRKRSLPRPPQVVGLVTGERSKARMDVVGSLKDAGIEAQVAFEAASMQGPEVVEEIKSALTALNAKPDVDVIVIARGGGSRTELIAFNDWTLAQAIVESRAPVITAIGHRQDKTLADLVADLSVPTPSSVGRVLAKQPAMRWEVTAIGAALVALIILMILGRVMGWW
jgi:hypothetical protein